MTAITRTFIGPKDPNEVVDYAFNWFDRWVAGDTITSVTWTLPEGLTNEDQPPASIDLDAEEVLTSIFIGGGTAGQNYDVHCRIVTDGGRTFDQTATLQVRSR